MSPKAPFVVSPVARTTVGNPRKWTGGSFAGLTWGCRVGAIIGAPCEWPGLGLHLPCGPSRPSVTAAVVSRHSAEPKVGFLTNYPQRLREDPFLGRASSRPSPLGGTLGADAGGTTPRRRRDMDITRSG